MHLFIFNQVSFGIPYIMGLVVITSLQYFATKGSCHLSNTRYLTMKAKEMHHVDNCSMWSQNHHILLIWTLI